MGSETYFLSSSGMINPLIFIIFFKILVIVVGEKCLPGPKLGRGIYSSRKPHGGGGIKTGTFGQKWGSKLVHSEFFLFLGKN